MEPRKKILVIDDEPAIQATIREFCAEKYEIVEASDGEKGLKAVSEHNPDLIILDLYMPAPSGIKVLEKLKTTPKTKHIPIIIISAGTVPKTFIPFKKYNLSSRIVLEKPFTLDALKEKIDKMLSPV